MITISSTKIANIQNLVGNAYLEDKEMNVEHESGSTVVRKIERISTGDVQPQWPCGLRRVQSWTVCSAIISSNRIPLIDVSAIHFVFCPV